ncbi:hypothetical protein, partial [Leisingera caerulea]|uniref:hypothetical protein n=1 Tax=Leisingera caerulea TaxID=506591 RepID=UPI003F4ABB5E
QLESRTALPVNPFCQHDLLTSVPFNASMAIMVPLLPCAASGTNVGFLRSATAPSRSCCACGERQQGPALCELTVEFVPISGQIDY